ncbi:MAG TPA: type II secretion system F family protein [Stellaceae bacterium]|nr:type II secretion system F family protein [Stellaceae bacterium]
MPRFRYRALRATGGEFEGELLAADEHEAASHLQDEGSYPLEIAPARAAARVATRPRGSRTIPSRELMLFTRQMAALLGAGVAPDRALSLIAEDRTQGRRARLAVALHASVERGESLSRALAASGAIPQHYVALVAAGEAQGDLGVAFERLAALVERNRAIGQSLVNALIYPASVLVVACLSISFLLGFVVPRFSALVEGFRAAPPLSLRFLLALATVFQDGSLPALVLAFAAVVWFAARRRDPAFRVASARRLLALPHVGALLAKVESERMTLLVGTMIEAGVALPAALAAARAAAGNSALALGLAEAERAVERGERLTRALAAADAVPALTLELVRVGEETGELPAMLLKASDILRREIEATAGQWIALVAPVSLVVLGLIVGLIALALFGTVLDAYDIAS